MHSHIIEKEKRSFDAQIEERIKHGFVPDLKRLRKVNWFYNNVWRDPRYVEIYWMPKVRFVIDIAKKRGGRVIEFGCGSGYLTLELARNGMDVTGIDLSPKSIEIAERYKKENRFKKGFGSLTYRCGDFMSMETGGGQFDSVIFFRSLHHVPDVDSLFYKIKGILKKRGNLIICEPIRKNFTKESAQFAAILRAVLPTWVPYNKKLKGLFSKKSWDKYVNDIYKEYTYKESHSQSPMDNKLDSAEKIIKAARRYFSIKTIDFSDAFIDKLIGGLRGPDRYELAGFLKFLDDLMVEKKILPPTNVCIHAVK